MLIVDQPYNWFTKLQIKIIANYIRYIVKCECTRRQGIQHLLYVYPAHIEKGTVIYQFKGAVVLAAALR